MPIYPLFSSCYFCICLSLPYFYSMSFLPSLPASFWSPFSSFRRHACDGNKMSTSHLKRLRNKMVCATHSLHIAPQNSLLSTRRRGSGLITVSNNGISVSDFNKIHQLLTLFYPECSPVCLTDTVALLWRLSIPSLGLSETQMGGDYFMKISQDLFYFFSSLSSWFSLWWEIF